ncbi:MAG: glucose-6-phosphate isomerase, partial [Winogradskyella sp.]|nr:glucose-6-phosphate isomerase [Winogradskyella sp.]
TEALLNGKTEKEVLKELKSKRLAEPEINTLLPFKVFTGNKPTNSIFINKLTPESLGKLIALYEHKIFVQGIVWNIFSYDQSGVELGKQLASTILDEINNKASHSHDSSTENLLKHYRQEG